MSELHFAWHREYNLSIYHGIRRSCGDFVCTEAIELANVNVNVKNNDNKLVKINKAILIKQFLIRPLIVLYQIWNNNY